MIMATDTPAGQVLKIKERAVMERVRLAAHCDVCAETEKSAPVDAVMVRGGAVVVVGEVKVRTFTHDELKRYGSLMVSTSKIRAGRKAASALRVPYMVWVAIKPNMLAKKIEQMDIAQFELVNSSGEYEPTICDPVDGQLISEVRVTQASINGGEKIDEVTLVPLELMRMI